MAPETATSAEPTLPPRLRVALIVAAAIETLAGVAEIVLGGLSATEEPGIGRSVIITCTLLRPIMGAVALVAAGRDRIRRALIAMAGVILISWLGVLPLLAETGLEFEGGTAKRLLALFQIAVVPVIGLGVLMLALHRERPRLAAALAVLPTFVSVVVFVVFVAMVVWHGPD